MTSLHSIIADFSSFYDDNPWFGDSYMDVISDITAVEALVTPPNGHSIAVILWHMVKWRKTLTVRLLGDRDFRTDMTDADNWPSAESQTPATWEAAKSAFAEQQTILMEQLGEREEVFLDTEFVTGRKYRMLVSGVLQHDIYHLGQIALLKGLIRKSETWKIEIG
jgi:uncharacterized damage-inducible protein DinB